MSHTENMKRRAEERQRKREEAERERKEQEAASGADGNAGGPDAPPPGQELATTTETPPTFVPAQQHGTATRPQPLTPDLIPEPDLIEASGDLTADERHDLAQCERAFRHANQAAWMKGKAAHAVRNRRLYREGGRTWAAYCEEEIGESESDVNRQIQEWPLAAAIGTAYTARKAVPASHIRALLPLTKTADVDDLAVAYTRLREHADELGLKVTAAALTSMVDRFSKETDPLPVAQFGAAVRAIAPAPRDRQVESREADTTGGHPNLGDDRTSEAKADAQAAEGTNAGERSAGGHPNLGDTSQEQRASEAAVQGGEETETIETVEAEVLDEARALALLTSLTQAAETLSDDLLEATPATLQAISAAARHIAESAESLI
ncbi:hypothetical protein F7Q99_36525 [Streptomyces kaniharaensis]|uniref:Uncharacterized protein n=1 Tax=Streptomyces kaniharaensis TaxID=212423 RepID=A0A6N7L3Z4_9ACTN|nr:hypothetical protein [Streptomyces kaniharaensis]MQS17549.1 hypothetical protein [Streptomyces kaniharaensis]